MNWYIIGGIVCAAVGTFLLTYGGIYRSRSESRQSAAQLEQISRDLAELKGKPKSDLSSDAVASVEKDIQTWARKFASDKQAKKLIADQKRSERESSLEHSNALAREYFAYFVTVIRDALASYVATNAGAVTFDLPEVSPTLFTGQNPNYAGTVVFSSNTSWSITTILDNRSPTFSQPWIVMRLLRQEPGGLKKSKGDLDLRFAADGKTFWLRLQEDFALAVPTDESFKPATEYEQTIKSTLLGLIEFQLLQD